MSEDYELCTYERHHKLKILLFLSSMRSYADKLRENKFKLNYSKIDSADFKKDYTKKLEKILKVNNVKEITSFEIDVTQPPKKSVKSLRDYKWGIV